MKQQQGVRRLLAAAVALCSLSGLSLAVWSGEPRLASGQAEALQTNQEISLTKSESGNPMLGFDQNGDILYGGDPSILVDGDTVYAYVGHDTSTNESYYMPDWHCYSSTDMIHWDYKGKTMDEASVSWGNSEVAAWAGQVMKYKEKYYFYYCTQDKNNRKSIGVAVSNSAVGPFVDIGKPLVDARWTTNDAHSWEDIDPTAWIETDEDGNERRYLCWGNTRLFICELNEDMISIKDQDGQPDTVSFGTGAGKDIVLCSISGMGSHTFTEAPYLYRQQGADGKYVGKYYLFFACDWREQMAYATTDDLMSGQFEFGTVLMEPSATGNTNHMAVFDFKGQTYFVYHDGSLPHGSGFRRVTCVEPISVKSDGTIDPIKKTATGLTGTVSQIMDSQGNYLAHVPFKNPLEDSFYPITGKQLTCDFLPDAAESEWEINPGKAIQDAQYVSIESNNKPGLYLTASKSGATVSAVLSQDVRGSDDEAKSMTFRTLVGLTGSGVTFESVLYPGYYLTVTDGAVTLMQTPDAENATFYVSTEMAGGTGNVQKTKRLYQVGETLNTEDIRVRLYQETGTDGKTEDVAASAVSTNAAEIDMSTEGVKRLKVTYPFRGKSYTEEIILTVVDAAYFAGGE